MREFTTEEQSKRLKELGIPVMTNDMQFKPIWSVGDLLDLLPKQLYDYEMKYEYQPFYDDWEVMVRDEPYLISGELQIQCNEDNLWSIDYSFECILGKLPHGTELVDVLVRAVELLAANGYDFK